MMEINNIQPVDFISAGKSLSAPTENAPTVSPKLIEHFHQMMEGDAVLAIPEKAGKAMTTRGHVVFSKSNAVSAANSSPASASSASDPATPDAEDVTTTSRRRVAPPQSNAVPASTQQVYVSNAAAPATFLPTNGRGAMPPAPPVNNTTEPFSAPVAVSTPEGVAAVATPAPIVANTPIPTVASTHTPTAASAPEGVAAVATPVPAVASTPEGVAAVATPAPTVASTPAPAVASTPAPAVASTPAPAVASTPAPEVASTPAPAVARTAA
ncbi:MAG: hypothetical protein IKP00_14920, partial [Victivallales bacterium]|nr:hypothetical protein [Victivallales bacterium]